MVSYPHFDNPHENVIAYARDHDITVWGYVHWSANDGIGQTFMCYKLNPYALEFVHRNVVHHIWNVHTQIFTPKDVLLCEHEEVSRNVNWGVNNQCGGCVVCGEGKGFHKGMARVEALSLNGAYIVTLNEELKNYGHQG